MKKVSMKKVAGLDYKPGNLDRTAPKNIWLQVNTDGDKNDRSEAWPGYEHLTWMDESIGGVEVMYVRADLAAYKGEEVK